VLVLLVRWWTARRRVVLCEKDRCTVAISSGAIIVGPADPDESLMGYPIDWPSEFLFTYRHPGSRHLWWPIRSTRAWGTTVAAPLWMLLIPLALITAAAGRTDTLDRRRARAGVCPSCGYDRAGIAPGALCPECGAAA
jgi:hypothetical protein